MRILIQPRRLAGDTSHQPRTTRSSGVQWALFVGAIVNVATHGLEGRRLDWALVLGVEPTILTSPGFTLGHPRII